MASWTPGWGCARERPRIIPQPQQGALQTALEIQDRQLKQLTEENEKLKGDLGQVRKELEEKDVDSQRLRAEMDRLIKQLVTQGPQSDELELKREVEEGRQEIGRLKAELDKAKNNDAKRARMSQAMEVLVLKKRKDDALQTELGEVMEELENIREEVEAMKEKEKMLEGEFQRVRKKLGRAKEQLENVRKDCEDQLGAMKEKEKMLERDSQRVRDELAATKEELRKVRKQLVEEEELRKGSEFKLKSIRESFKMIDEGAVGSGARGVENEAGQGPSRNPTRAGGGVKDNESCNSRSVSGKHGSSSAPMEPSKKVKLEAKVGTGSSGKKSADASSGEGTSTLEVGGDTQRSLEEAVPPTHVPCITIDSDSDSEDELEEAAQPQQAPVIVPAQAPGRGRRRVPKSNSMVPPIKAAILRATPSSENDDAPKRDRSPDLETDATGVVVILSPSDYDVDEQQGNVEDQVGSGPTSSTVSAPINDPAGSPSRKETAQAQSSSNDHPSHIDDDVADDTEPIETTGADQEIDTKITLPVEKVIQCSTLNRKVTLRQRQKQKASRNGASRHPVPCITIDSDSDSDDGLDETQNQQPPAPVHAAPSIALPAQVPEEGDDFNLSAETRGRGRVRKSNTIIPPAKPAAGPRDTTSSEHEHEAPNRARSPDLEVDSIGVVVIVPARDCNEHLGPTIIIEEISQSSSNDHPRDTDSDTGCSAEGAEPIETTGADPEIDIKIPVEKVLRRSIMNRNVTRGSQNASQNGGKKSRIPRRVPRGLTRRLHHGEDKANPLYCLCRSKFASRPYLKQHVSYFKAEPQRCDVCNRSYTTLQNLHLHKKRMHSNPKRRKLTPKPKLPMGPKKIVEIGRGKEDIHGFSHEGPSGNGAGPGPSSGCGTTQYFCKCGQQFPGNGAFLEHMNKIKLEGTFKCCWCPCGFNWPHSLTHHQKTFHAAEFALNELKRKLTNQ